MWAYSDDIQLFWVLGIVVVPHRCFTWGFGGWAKVVSKTGPAGAWMATLGRSATEGTSCNSAVGKSGKQPSGILNLVVKPCEQARYLWTIATGEGGFSGSDAKNRQQVAGCYQRCDGVAHHCPALWAGIVQNHPMDMRSWALPSIRHLPWDGSAERLWP